MTHMQTELLQRAQGGDRRALETLLAEQAPRIARYAERMCRNRADAEEVVQETLIAAARTLVNFRGDAALSTWLYTIARSFCIKQRRRGRTVRRADTSLDDPQSLTALTLSDDEDRPDRALGERQLGQALDSAIGELAPMYREVLVLRDVEGLSAAEVAQSLGLGVDAVKSRLHRARLTVRDRLAPMLLPSSLPNRPTTARCPDVLTTYSRHLEGDIRPEMCAEMEAHLAQCPYCAGQCDSLRRTLTLCARAPGLAVTPSTQQLVRQALRRAIDAGTQ
jgi:RNA polymerase sigma-70 factor (ECF subfamily)